MERSRACVHVVHLTTAHVSALCRVGWSFLFPRNALIYHQFNVDNPPIVLFFFRLFYYLVCVCVCVRVCVHVRVRVRVRMRVRVRV